VRPPKLLLAFLQLIRYAAVKLAEQILRPPEPAVAEPEPKRKPVRLEPT
jgi:hypothetical protein